ncbi:MAG TPA: hypothetical protein VG737_05725 [Cyclobacteriaceae bacterium]|nr:hypothetical protein [Cyclobacteriaceae bacterium]
MIGSRLLILIGFAWLSSFVADAQIVGEVDEAKLYAESKQLNQFLRRFNGEEDEKGKRFYPGDKQFRNTKLRKKYLTILFDGANAGMTDQLKAEFTKNVLDKSDAAVLDFHGGNWFSEVQATFSFNGKEQVFTLFMEIEKDHLGYKWVINHVYAEVLKPYFVRDTTKVGRFLHPMSHELDFMNLRKAFANTDSVSQFTAKRFQPDHLSIFLYELKKKNIAFKSVTQVKFHFFQIDGWYFEVANFNRPGFNTGWLISNLVKLKNDGEKEVMCKYLFYENR